MSLLKPTPGQMLDRLAILGLKIAAAREKRKPYEHFSKEADELFEAVSRLDHEAVRRTSPLAGNLREVHRQLWNEVEQQKKWVLREIELTDREQAVMLIKLYNLNQARNALVEAIDTEFGAFVGEEKL